MNVAENHNMRCPNCKRDTDIRVEVRVWATLTGDGTDLEAQDYEWDDDSDVECNSCGHNGTVKGFEIPEDEEPEDWYWYVSVRYILDADGKITDYQVLNHGQDGSQYFPGCGVAFTDYSDVVTGCHPDSAAEALDDALESMAQNSVKISDEMEREMVESL